MKRPRRIEIVQYRRLIVSEGLSSAADPTDGPSAVDVILKKLFGLPRSDRLDEAGLTGDDEVADDRLPRPYRNPQNGKIIYYCLLLKFQIYGSGKTGEMLMYTLVTTKSLVLLTTMLIIGLVSIPAGGQDIKSESNSSISGLPGENPNSFIGTWIVQTQITNCSGVVTENFSKFVSIHAGGTANEMSNSLPPSQRTTAFGVWQPLYQRNFVYALRFFRFTPTGTFASTVQANGVS